MPIKQQMMRIFFNAFRVFLKINSYIFSLINMIAFALKI
jgi:hypothetical protein